MKKNIAILGSTGSIGTNTLDIIAQRRSDFRVVGLSAHQNIRLLARQIQQFRPKVVCVRDEAGIEVLERLVSLKGLRVYTQENGLQRIAAHHEVEMVVVATSGTVSLLPTLQAIEHGKTIALANKEPLVMAGEIVMEYVRKYRCQLLPIDSEHSAIFQCLQKEDPSTVKTIFLTASGGPFRDLPKKRLRAVDVHMALKHPRWKMGKKISIDSATLMNKGLEIIEARWLFGISADRIKILIHPEAIIHSMVEFRDGSILAQMGITDMRLPIQYALDYPRRQTNSLPAVDFLQLRQLSFQAPDEGRFPCLRIAQQVARKGGSSCCVMNAANEIAVEAFLHGTIRFTDIPRVISTVLKKHRHIAHPDLREILRSDAWSRQEARTLCYPR